MQDPSLTLWKKERKCRLSPGDALPGGGLGWGGDVTPYVSSAPGPRAAARPLLCVTRWWGASGARCEGDQRHSTPAPVLAAWLSGSPLSWQPCLSGAGPWHNPFP